MRSISRFASTNGGFVAFLIIFVGLFMFAVKLGLDALPFPLQSQYSDAVVSHWPDALFFQRSAQNGSFPLWRDLLMSGQPFAANPLNKVWYPPQWLVLLLPATVHLNLMIWLHMVLAGIGMRAFGTRLKLSCEIAGTMGLAYALAPRLWVATGAGHLDIVYASAWIPWILWAVNKVILDVNGIGQRVAILSMVCTLSFLADMRTSVFGFGIGIAFGIWTLWQHRLSIIRIPLLILLASTLLAIGLTAVQWLPLLQLAPYLSRNGLTAADSAVYSLNPALLLGLVVPERFGFHETLTYAGIIMLILAIIAVIRSPRKHLFWLGLIVFGALYAFGNQGPLWPVLVRLLPPLLWLRVPARAWIVVIVALTVLAGFGIEALTGHLVQRLLPLVGIGLLSVGIAWGVIARQWTLPSGAGIATLIGFVVMGCLLLVIQRLPKNWLIPLLGLLIVLDLAWMDISLVHGVPSSTWLDAYQPLAQALHDAGVTRLYSPDYSLPQQAAAYWQIPEFGGIDPFQSAAYVKAFGGATGTKVNGYTVTLPPYDTTDPHLSNHTAIIDTGQLARWSVSHVLTSFPLDNQNFSLVRRIDNLYLYKNMLMPTGISLAWNGSNRFIAKNEGKAPVNVAAWMPSWNIAPENHDDAAIIVQPGQTLTASYELPSLNLGIAITAMSLILTGIAIFAGSKQRG